MPDIRLVAVEHGASGHLVGSNMFPLIQREVVPHLTNDSVIVAEGGRGRGILHPGNPHYNTIYRQLGSIAFSGITPILHSDDALYHFKTSEEVVADLAQFEKYQSAVSSFLSFQDPPTTWETLIERIRNGRHDVAVSGVLDEEWRKFAKSEVMVTTKRDNLFAKQILRHAKKARRVFFFGGILHCVSLTAKYVWPVIRYECPPEYIKGCYTLWYITNRVTAHLD